MPATRGVRKRNLANVSDQVGPSTAASAAGSSLPTLAALRQARASREALLRRILPIGFGALVIVVVATSRAKPGAGLHGASLGVTLALAGFALAAIGGFAALLVHRSGAWLLVPVLILLMVSSSVLVWLQPDGAGPVGLLIAVGVAARIIPGRTSVVMLTACLGFLLVAESGQPEPPASRHAGAPGQRAPAGRDLHDRAVRPADQDAGGPGGTIADRAGGEPRRRAARGRAGRTAAAGPRHARCPGPLAVRAAAPARGGPAARAGQPGRRAAGRDHRPRPRAGQERPGRGAPGHRHAPRRRPARPGPAGRAHRGLPGRHRRARPVQLVGNPEGTSLRGPPRAVPGDPGGADQRAQARPPGPRRGPRSDYLPGRGQPGGGGLRASPEGAGGYGGGQPPRAGRVTGAVLPPGAGRA